MEEHCGAGLALSFVFRFTVFRSWLIPALLIDGPLMLVTGSSVSDMQTCTPALMSHSKKEEIYLRLLSHCCVS